MRIVPRSEWGARPPESITRRNPNTLDGIVDGMASRVGDAADRNFRRWMQFPPRDNSHAAEIALLKAFLRRRAAWIKTQLDTNF